MCVISYKVYEQQEINFGLDIIRFARLYKPGDGIIGRMTRVRREYTFQRIVIAFDGEVAVGCIVTDFKKTQPGWSSYRAHQSDTYMRVNTWVKPSYRRRGIGKNLMTLVGVNDLTGVECYDTGSASKKLYSVLKDNRMV